MSRNRKRGHAGRQALDLVEEAVHLLRATPAATLAVYYVGALPFVLTFLYFWSDMSRSAFADERLEPLAAVLTLLFFWMKFCQAAFVRRLWAQVSGVSPERLSIRTRMGREAAHCFWQATGFVILPVAFIVAVPFGWCFAFYQSLTALGGTTLRGEGSVFSRALRHAWIWPGQNHVILSILFGAGLVVFLNVSILLLAIPFLLKTLFGVESVFSQSAWAMLNTTFLISAAGLAWLCVDPLVKAVYVLRCFQIGARTTGEDIRAELRALTGRDVAPLVAVVALAVFVTSATAADVAPVMAGDAPAGESRSATAVGGVAAAGDLDRAIDDVLQRREYAWRLPREKPAAEAAADSWLQRTIDRLLAWIELKAKALGRNVVALIRWIFDKLFGGMGPTVAGGRGWKDAIRGLFILLLIVLVAAIGYLGYRLWKNFVNYLPEVLAQPAPGAPDLTDDSVTAAQLPEDEWLRLAREMIAKGEFRLGLRALYLAGLAHLADRGFLTIARYKSNREYALELGRRGHAVPDIMNAFTHNVSVFDRVWYGRHEVTREVVADFENNLKRIAAA